MNLNFSRTTCRAAKYLALDLSGVTYLSSAGLREIVAADKRITSQDEFRQGVQRVGIFVSEDVQRALELAGVDEILKLMGSNNDLIDWLLQHRESKRF